MDSKGFIKTFCLLAGILFLTVGIVQAAPTKVPPVSLGPKTLLGDGTPPTAYEFFLQPGSSWKGDIGGIVAGKTYSLVILDIDVTGVTGPAGRQIYFNLQDAESGSSFKNLGINVVLQAAGSGGPALFQAYQQFTSEGLSSHGLNAGELTESDFDLRFDFTKTNAGDPWTVTPYFRMFGGSWTLFFDGPFVATASFNFLGAKLVVAFDWGADGTVSFNNYYLKGPASTVYVDDNWVGLTEGTAVQFPGQTDYRTIGVDAFATIQAGVDNVSGSTVNVAAGTYNETGTFPDGFGGTHAGLKFDSTRGGITLSGANAGTPGTGTRGAESIIEGPNVEHGNAIYIFNGADGVIVDGFTLKAGDDIVENRADNVVIKNNIITPISGDIPFDTQAPGIFACECSNLTVAYNLILDIGMRDPTTGGVGIYLGLVGGLYPVSNSLIEHNLIDNSNGTGILAYDTQGGGITIRYNTIRNVGTSGSYHDDGIRAGALGNGLTIQYNEIYGCTQDGIDIRHDATTHHINYNSIHDNDGYGVTTNQTGPVDASGNWLGSNDAVTVAGEVSANIDYTPWLHDGTDQGGDPGFQPDLSYLHVDDNSPQTGTTGRIQEGMNLVTASTVKVEAGTYDEQVVIKKSLILMGEGNATIIRPTSIPRLFPRYDGTALNTACIIVADSVATGGVTVKKLRVDASGITSMPGGASGFFGIQYRETDGLIDSVTVDGFSGTISPSLGFYLSGVWNTTTIEVARSAFSNYTKNGITANGYTPGGYVTANIHHNTVTGLGYHASYAQNGIQLGNGATGTIQSNTVSSHSSGTAWAACGILIYGGSGDILSNTVTDNQIGVDYEPGSGNVNNNQITATATGTGQSQFWGIVFAIYGAKGSRKLAQPFDEGEAGEGGKTSYTASVNNNIVNGDDSPGGVGINPYVESPHSLNFTASGNTVTDWGIGFDMDQQAGATLSASANLNNIMSNLTYGAQSNVSSNFKYNWWNHVSGPFHTTTNPSGTGDPITDNVSYSPWLGEPVPTIAPVAYHVNPSGTIQEAIDYASIGDSVLVHLGTYTLDDVVADIYKAITVQSTGGASVTFIQKTPHPMGWGDGAVRLRDANGITFDGFTVRNSATANEGAGILIGAPFAGSNDHRSNNNTVKNCVVDNASIGIYLYETSGNTIQNNEVFGMRDQPAGSFGVGIILWDDEPTGTSHNTNNAITGNNVHDCDRFGFALGGWGAPADRFDVTGTAITNNVFTNNYCNPDCQSLGFMFAQGLLTLSGNVITPVGEKEFFYNNTEILDSVRVNGDYFWTPDWLNPFSIQEAIYTVIPGGTVVVEAGTYVEDITIGKSLTLIGAGTGKGLTLVKPGTDQAYVPPPTNSGVTVINVTANNVTIKDLEVDGTMTAGDPGLRTNMAKRGIYGSSVNNFRVEGCKVIRCVSGIVGVLSTNLNFHGNTLDDCGHSFNVGGGIYLWGSSGDVGILGKPNVLTNIVDCGIMYHASSSGNAKYNQMTNCELGMLVNGNNNPTTFDHNNIQGTSIYGGIQVVHPVAAVTIGNDSVLCDYDALLVFNSGTNTVTVTDNHFYYTSTKGSEDQRHYRIPWMGEEYSGKMAYTLLNDKSGESGIYLSTESTYGDGPMYATITGNIVAGYDYDVRCHERSGDPSQLMDVDANGGAGINFFYGYGTYAWYMDNCNDDINATYNYWGKSLVSQIEQGIYHQVDNPTLGLVDFSNPYLLGDVNTDRVINVVDVVYLINYIFINGPPPYLLILGDTNRDGQIDVEDVVTLINYLFLSGPPPIVSEEK